MTPRALLLAAALAWPGVGWSQPAQKCLVLEGGRIKEAPCDPSKTIQVPSVSGEPVLSGGSGPGSGMLRALCERLSPEAIAQLQPHRYTPAEIDRMRAAVRKKLTRTGKRWVYGRPGEPSQAVDVIEPPSEEAVKNYLLVYIAAGITAEELEKQ